MIERIEAHFEAHGCSFFAAKVKRDRTLIGFMGLSISVFDAPFTPCVENGWHSAAEYWGQGLAAEGARVVADCGFQQLGLHEVVAFTVPGNARSRRVMEKLAMKHDLARDFDHPRLTPDDPLRRRTV